MQDAILTFLKSRREHVSGEELSDHLAISRQALWKHIQQLKDDGYEIVAVPHLGYKLARCPDRLLPAEVTYHLHTKFIGKQVQYFESVASTMDVAAQYAQEGAPEGTLVVAEGQAKGRGRMRRAWESPRHKGIYCSLIVRPAIPAQQVPLLTLLTGVSACEAIAHTCSLAPRIKWPNDILLREKKTGGILTEMNAETDAARFVVIGIGLNVNTASAHLPPGATSLAVESGHALSRLEVLQEFLRCFEANYLHLRKEGGAQILSRWREFSLTLGKRVRVTFHASLLEGTALDVDEDGALLVRTDAGIVRRVTAGDVVHCR